jgi:hypothetical protein
MTLGQFFSSVSSHPEIATFYFVALPSTAFLSNIFSKGESHQTPWKYLYSGLIYLASIPGIFAITLSAYLFLFERQSIMDTNLFTQIFPVLCMMLTLWLVSRNISLQEVPGFDKLGSLIVIITALISMMWILEKTRIIIFSFMPFYQFILLFIAFLIFIRWSWNRLFSR